MISGVDELRDPIVLTGIKSVQLNLVVDAPAFAPEIISEAKQRFDRQVSDLLKAAKIAIVDEKTSPVLQMAVLLRTVRECASGMYFHVFRVESMLREKVELPRGKKTAALVDVWRHRATIGYVPQNYDGRALEAHLFKETTDQAKDFLADFAVGNPV